LISVKWLFVSSDTSGADYACIIIFAFSP